jgi:hypothetical protein
MKRNGSLLLVAVMVGALGVVGCNGSGDDSADEGTTTAQQSAAVADGATAAGATTTNDASAFVASARRFGWGGFGPAWHRFWGRRDGDRRGRRGEGRRDHRRG